MTSLVDPGTRAVWGTARAALYGVAATGTRGSQAAGAALSHWRRVEAALSPVLGAAGVAALYRRSLLALRDTHPALAGVHEASAAAGDFEPLRQALAQQSQADAAITQSALMQVFRDRLAGLIGAPLSERLLSPAGAPSRSGAAGQDTPS